jgi:DNA primase
VLKLALQHPGVCGEPFRDIEPEDFTHPWYREIFEVIVGLGGPGSAGRGRVLAALPVGGSATTVSALSVEGLHVSGEVDGRVAMEYAVRLRELAARRRIEQLKSRLQRMSPVTQASDYNRMFGELVALESHRRALREQAIASDA